MASSAPFPPDLALDRSVLRARPPDAFPATRAAEAAEPVDHLPGFPTVGLEQAQVHGFFRDELATPALDELYGMLWLFSIKSGRNIDPLHRQRVKGRTVVATDDAKLHMVWTKGRIYVKALPACLLNHGVWSVFLDAREPARLPVEASDPGFDRRVALGFLRSYSLLVRSPLDFALAKEAHLIPGDLDITWTRWAKFAACLRTLDDDDVAKRYHFGQIRLNRLNWAVRIVRPRAANSSLYYNRHHWFLTEAISQWFPLLLFTFASLSLVLSSMQVAVAVAPHDLSFGALDERQRGLLATVFWVFSLATIVGSALTWVVLILVPVGVFASQMYWAVTRKGVPDPRVLPGG